MKKKFVLVVFETDCEENLANIKKTIEQETSCCSCTLKAIHFSEIHNESEDEHIGDYVEAFNKYSKDRVYKPTLDESEGGE